MNLDRPNYEKDYLEDWEDFWKKICTNEDGSINLDQIKRELYDFHNVMREVALVYDHCTGGRISKINTDSGHVISEIERNYEHPPYSDWSTKDLEEELDIVCDYLEQRFDENLKEIEK